MMPEATTAVTVEDFREDLEDALDYVIGMSEHDTTRFRRALELIQSGAIAFVVIDGGQEG